MTAVLPNAPLLAVEDLHVRFQGAGAGPYRPVQALNGVHLQVSAGETLGLIGESGSGKSVLLRTLLRLQPRSAQIQGRVQFAGEDLLALAPKALQALRGGKVAMVFQEPGLAFDPVYTIGDQIAEVVRVHEQIDRTHARARALAMLERVQIPQARRRLDAYPHELSGGMRQRAMIALALVCRPQLLLADEPTTALDATVQAQILQLLRDLQQEFGMALILVTHDLAAAAQIADRIAVMYAGRVVEQGPARVLLQQPAHPYTRGLLSASLDGAVAGVPLTTIAGAPPDLSNLPVGCAFADRCGQVQAECRRVAPGWTAADGRGVACWQVSAP